MLNDSNLLDIAVSAAERGAAFVGAAERPTAPDAWTRKGLNDFVTEVDRGAEAVITAHLREQTPDAIVQGEELSPEAMGDGLVWVVDPLDGIQF